MVRSLGHCFHIVSSCAKLYPIPEDTIDLNIINLYSKSTMRRACLISFLMIFTLGLISAGFTTHSFGCAGIDAYSIEKAHKERISDASISNFDSHVSNSENDGNSKEPFHSSDCNCPGHRTHCCSSLVMFDKIERPHFINFRTPQRFFEKTYSVKQAPFLEGPFQPPRV